MKHREAGNLHVNPPDLTKLHITKQLRLNVFTTRGLPHTHSGKTEGLGPQGLTPLYGITWDLLIFALELQFTLVFYVKILPTNTYSTTGFKLVSHRSANQLIDSLVFLLMP